MYVKVLTRDRDGAETCRLFDCGPEASYGAMWVSGDPDSTPWLKLLGIEAVALTHVVTGPEGWPTPPEGEQGEEGDRRIRWAWWWARPDEGTHRDYPHSIEAVVTCGDLFVMSDRGDTVERVR